MSIRNARGDGWPQKGKAYLVDNGCLGDLAVEINSDLLATHVPGDRLKLLHRVTREHMRERSIAGEAHRSVQRNDLQMRRCEYYMRNTRRTQDTYPVGVLVEASAGDLVPGLRRVHAESHVLESLAALE